MSYRWLAYSFAVVLSCATSAWSEPPDYLPCLHSVLKNNDNFVLNPTSGVFWVPMTLSNAEANCKSCQAIEDKAARSACMAKAAETLGKSRYETEMERIAANISKYNGYNKDQKPTEVMAKVYERCPSASWDSITKGPSRTTANLWLNQYGTSSDPAMCALRALCQDDETCVEDNFSHMGSARSMSAQYILTQQAAEVVVDPKKLDQKVTYMDFDPEEVQGDPVPPPKPYQSSTKSTKGMSLPQYLDAAKKAETRPDDVTNAETGALQQKMGCTDNASYSLSSAITVCLANGTGVLEPQTFGTIDDVKKALNEQVYKRLAAFAARKMWESYALAFLMDPQTSGLQFGEPRCKTPAGRRTINKEVESMIGTDGWFAWRGNPSENIDSLKSCFSPDPGDGHLAVDQPSKETGSTPRIEALVQSTVNMRCGIKFGNGVKLDGDTCPQGADAFSDAGGGRDEQIKSFEKRAKDMQVLNEQRKNLLEGKFSVNGTPVKCPGYNSCGDYLKKCPKTKLVEGCVGPEVQSDKSLFWKVYNGFEQTENFMLSRYPELNSKVLTADGEVPAWKSVYDDITKKRGSGDKCPVPGGNKMSCQRMLEDRYDIALRGSRQSKLDAIKQACDDPKEYAQKLLAANPSLVNEFLQDELKKNPDSGLGMLLCVGLDEAQAKARSDKYWKMGANAAAFILGMAAAIPTGGASLGLVLGAASAGTMVGVTAYDIKKAYDTMKMENGMLHGCIGDFKRARESEKALEDAMIRAAIDLGLGVGFFAGMGVVEKLVELKRLAAVAKGIEGAEPAWAASLSVAQRTSKSWAKTEGRLAAEEYGLTKISGMAKSGGQLTKDGEKAAALILDLEKAGVKPDTIKKMLGNAGCSI